MVCITDPDRHLSVPGRYLSELFGLTQAEAALAEALLAGQELRDIAEQQGRSINTMRTHLARLMAKTEVNRQSELLRLLGTIPRSD